MPDRSLRQQIRDWWHGQIDGAEGIDIKTWSDRCVDDLLRDTTFCERFVREFAKPIVYDLGLNILSNQRGLVAMGTRFLTRDQIIDEIESERPDWSKWLEHDPISGDHVALFTMTKEQALAAAEARERRAQPDLRRAALLRLAADKLRPGQRIGDAWTEDALSAVERRLTLTRPKFRLKPESTDRDELTGVAD